MKNYQEYKNINTEIELIDIALENIKLKELELTKEKERLTKIKTKYDNALKNLKGIEESLLYYIIVKDLNVTKAVDKVAFQYDLDVSSIWKSYYPKVKKILLELE